MHSNALLMCWKYYTWETVNTARKQHLSHTLKLCVLSPPIFGRYCQLPAPKTPPPRSITPAARLRDSLQPACGSTCGCLMVPLKHLFLNDRVINPSLSKSCTVAEMSGKPQRWSGRGVVTEQILPTPSSPWPPHQLRTPKSPAKVVIAWKKEKDRVLASSLNERKKIYFLCLSAFQ